MFFFFIDTTTTEIYTYLHTLSLHAALPISVDWFQVVQLFTRALDEVRKSEARLVKMPTAVRWAVLKAKEKNLTAKQEAALAELEASGLLTGVAWQIKEKLRWVDRKSTRLNSSH